MVVSHNVIYITGLGRKVASMYWYFGVMLWPFSVLFFKKKLYETLMSEGFQTVIIKQILHVSNGRNSSMLK